MVSVFPSILPDYDKDPDDNSGTLMTAKGYEAQEEEADDESDTEADSEATDSPEISDTYDEDSTQPNAEKEE